MLLSLFFTFVVSFQIYLVGGIQRCLQNTFDFSVTRTTQIVYRSKPENYANSECVAKQNGISNKWKTVECDFHALSVPCRKKFIVHMWFYHPKICIYCNTYNSTPSITIFYVLHIEAHPFRHFWVYAHVKFSTDDSNTRFLYRLHKPGVIKNVFFVCHSIIMIA